MNGQKFHGSRRRAMLAAICEAIEVCTLVSAMAFVSSVKAGDDACPEVAEHSEQNSNAQYMSIPGAQYFKDHLTEQTLRCFEDLIALSRNRPDPGHAVLDRESDTDTVRALRYLIATRLSDMTLSRLMDLLARAENRYLWYWVLSDLETGKKVAVDETDPDRQRAWMPEGPEAFNYAYVMQAVSGNPEYWARVPARA